MTSITDIDINDIKLFLQQNNIKIPTTKQRIYDVAKDLILNNKADFYPDVIIDWIIAYNFYLSNQNVRSYSKNEILNLSNKELSVLAKKLGLDIVDINSIINVLFYLKKLKQIKKKTYLDLTPLPELNVKIIVHTDLKTLLDNLKLDGSIRPLIDQSIPELLINNLNNQTIIKDFISKLGTMGEFKLLRKVIETLSQLEPKKQYLKYLNFDTLIKFLQYDKSVEDLIYDEMEAIVINGVKNQNYKKAKGNEIEFEDTFEYFLSRLNDLKDFKLMKKLINEYSLLYNKDDLFYWLLDNNFVLNAANSTDLMQKYLELNPNYQFRDLAKFIYYGGLGLKGLEYANYRIKILTAAIKAKSINIFQYFINSQENINDLINYEGDEILYRGTYVKKEDMIRYLNKMNDLIEQVKKDDNSFFNLSFQ